MPVALNDPDKVQGEIALASPEPESKPAFLEDVPMVLNDECIDHFSDVLAPSSSEDSLTQLALMSFLREGWGHRDGRQWLACVMRWTSVGSIW